MKRTPLGKYFDDPEPPDETLTRLLVAICVVVVVLVAGGFIR